MGGIYVIVRVLGAIALLKNGMWGFVLSIINCLITMALMIFMLPSGIIDGILACTALILILAQHFGNKKIIELSSCINLTILTKQNLNNL